MAKGDFVNVHGYRVRRNKTAKQLADQMQRIQESGRFKTFGSVDKMLSTIDNTVGYNDRTGNLEVKKNAMLANDPNRAFYRFHGSGEGKDISNATFGKYAGTGG